MKMDINLTIKIELPSWLQEVAAGWLNCVLKDQYPKIEYDVPEPKLSRGGREPIILVREPGPEPEPEVQINYPNKANNHLTPCEKCDRLKPHRWVKDGVCIKCRGLTKEQKIAKWRSETKEVGAEKPKKSEPVQETKPKPELQRLPPARKAPIPSVAADYHPYLALNEKFGQYEFSFAQAHKHLNVALVTASRWIGDLLTWDLLEACEGKGIFKLKPFKEPTLKTKEK